MIIGLLEISLGIPGSRSLKDKRRVLKSSKDQIRNRFNVAIAETGSQDDPTAASLSAVTVSNDTAVAHGVLEAVARYLEGRGDAVVRDYHIQML